MYFTWKTTFRTQAFSLSCRFPQYYFIARLTLFLMFLFIYLLLTCSTSSRFLNCSAYSISLLNVLINWPYIIFKIWNNYRKGSLCLSNLCLSPGVTCDLFALSREKESLSRWFFTDLTNSIYVMLKLITGYVKISQLPKKVSKSTENKY